MKTKEFYWGLAVDSELIVHYPSGVPSLFDTRLGAKAAKHNLGIKEAKIVKVFLTIVAS